METVFRLQKNRKFSLEDARQILPLVRSVTSQAAKKVDALVEQIEANPHVSDDLENQVNKVIETWQGKIERLGGVPMGLWVVDFDFGGGYFCWKFPETDITHWHDYSNGYAGRKPIDVWTKKAAKA